MTAIFTAAYSRTVVTALRKPCSSLELNRFEALAQFLDSPDVELRGFAAVWLRNLWPERILPMLQEIDETVSFASGVGTQVYIARPGDSVRFESTSAAQAERLRQERAEWLQGWVDRDSKRAPRGDEGFTTKSDHEARINEIEILQARPDIDLCRAGQQGRR